MNHKFEKPVKRIYAMLSCFVLVAVMTVCPAFAADDPLAVVTNLSDFIFSLIRAIGLILLGFGVLQLGLSLKSHDPSQRANGMLTVAGGIVITFTKEILSLITGWKTRQGERHEILLFASRIRFRICRCDVLIRGSSNHAGTLSQVTGISLSIAESVSHISSKGCWG